jgi:YD repeat-containing protein
MIPKNPKTTKNQQPMRTSIYRFAMAAAITVCATAAMTGCDKEADDNNPTPSGQQALTNVRTEISDGITSTYTFDDQRRITRTDQSDGSYTTFSYSGSQLTALSFDAETNEEETLTAQVDANGRVVQLNLEGETFTYAYNADGRPTTSSGGGETTTYTYEDGNLTSTATTYDGITEYQYYSYLTDKQETRYTADNALFGNPSRNLLSTVSTVDGPVRTHTYEFDSSNRVTKETVTFGEGSEPIVTTYTY